MRVDEEGFKVQDLVRQDLPVELLLFLYGSLERFSNNPLVGSIPTKIPEIGFRKRIWQYVFCNVSHLVLNSVF